MAQQAARAAGPADPQVVALMQGFGDKRGAVAAALARFEAALVKATPLETTTFQPVLKGFSRRHLWRRRAWWRPEPN
jgi:hypothetical protein